MLWCHHCTSGFPPPDTTLEEFLFYRHILPQSPTQTHTSPPCILPRTHPRHLWGFGKTLQFIQVCVPSLYTWQHGPTVHPTSQTQVSMVWLYILQVKHKSAWSDCTSYKSNTSQQGLTVHPTSQTQVSMVRLYIPQVKHKSTLPLSVGISQATVNW